MSILRNRVIGHLCLVVVVFLFSVFLLMAFPMLTDEAYYMDWAKRSVGFGFFDHPPFVSWQALLSKEFPGVQFARIGVFLTSCITFAFNYLTAKEFLQSRRQSVMTAVIAQSSFAGVANSFLLTPDSGLAMAWSIALHEALFAIKKDPKRWLTAGAATGLGLMSKYTMVLIGPVFLYALIKEGRHQLKSAWPYLGGLMAALVFVPNIWWNSQNNWITFKFQFAHGTSVKQDISTHSSLPPIAPATKGTSAYMAHESLQKAMSSVSGFEETRQKEHPYRSKLEVAWQYMGDYLGGVLALWGGYALFFLWKLKSKASWPRRTTYAGSSLIFIATVFPLAFFAVLSPFSKIEANWPAMHMASGSILMGLYLQPTLKLVGIVTLVHELIVSIIVVSLSFLSFLPSIRENRIVVESKGYDELVMYLKKTVSSKLLAVDSYQLKSAIAARSSGLETVQWPKITRPSEYTRGGKQDLLVEQKLLKEDQFQLLTFEDMPSNIEGYEVTEFSGLRACPDGEIGLYSASHPHLPCKHGIRDWWLVTYSKIKNWERD